MVWATQYELLIGPARVGSSRAVQRSAKLYCILSSLQQLGMHFSTPHPISSGVSVVRTGGIWLFSTGEKSLKRGGRRKTFLPTWPNQRKVAQKSPKGEFSSQSSATFQIPEKRFITCLSFQSTFLPLEIARHTSSDDTGRDMFVGSTWCLSWQHRAHPDIPRAMTCP